MVMVEGCDRCGTPRHDHQLFARINGDIVCSECWKKAGRPFSAGKTAVFPSRHKAKEIADFFAMGFDEDEVQSVNVVPAPQRIRE